MRREEIRLTSFRRAAGILLLMVVVSLVGDPAAQGQQPPGPALEPFRIGVGDVIRISVWKDPELSATVPVRPDGGISLPLIGDVRAAGATPVELQSLLTERFSEYLTAPAISIVLQEINSRRIFVTGEVREPGVYDILQPTRLMQALAMAGGITEFAKQDKIVILRQQEDGGEQRLEASVSAITSGRDPSDNLLLEPGDTIFVP